MNKRRIGCGVLAGVVLAVSVIILLAGQMDRPYHVKQIVDGDTVEFVGGKTVKLLGVKTMESGQDNATMSAAYLKAILDGRNVWIEGDRNRRDEEGQRLVWLWVGCESTPKFLLSVFRGAGENPIGCKKGVLVNEQIVKMGWSKVFLADGRLARYLARLHAVEK